MDGGGGRRTDVWRRNVTFVNGSSGPIYMGNNGSRRGRDPASAPPDGAVAREFEAVIARGFAARTGRRTLMARVAYCKCFFLEILA